MAVFMFMLMFMMMLVFELDVERTCLDAVRIRPGDAHVVARHVQAFERGQELDLRRAQVQQCGHGHVAADPGRTFQVEDPAHDGCPVSVRVLMRAARYPAPNPLSMFTTLMPSAQEFSMVSSGATPLNDAP